MNIAEVVDHNNLWKSKVTGVWDARRGLVLSVARAALGGGTNLTIELLHRTFHTRQASSTPCAELGVIELDNTVGENKTRAMIAYAGFLIETGRFKRVIIFFRPKGHTFTLLDQSFSKLIRQLRHFCVFTPSDLVKRMYSIMKDRPLCAELPYTP